VQFSLDSQFGVLDKKNTF